MRGRRDWRLEVKGLGSRLFFKRYGVEKGEWKSRPIWGQEKMGGMCIILKRDCII